MASSRHGRPRISGHGFLRLRRSALVAAAAVVAITCAPAVARGHVPPADVVTERLQGANRYEAAAGISRKLSEHGGVPAVYLVPPAFDAESTLAAPMAAIDGGAILYADRDALQPVVAAELQRLRPARVAIVGSTGEIGAKAVAQVRSLLGAAVTIERFAGATPADTAVALSKRGFVEPVEIVLVASSASAFDALVAAAAAAALHAPLLLVPGDALPASAAAELRRLAPLRVALIGGTAAIGDPVLRAIQAIVPATERLTAADRSSQAAAVARYLLPHTGGVLAVGPSDDAFALAAIPLAASRQAPLLLTQRGDQLPTATRDTLIAIAPRYLYLAGAIPELIRGELIGYSDGRIGVPAEEAHYPTWDAGWHDPGEMLTIIKATEIAHPDLVRVFSIGKSAEGRDLWAAKVSDNVGVDEDEPEVMVDALHHASEHLGVEQALYLLDTLASGYGKDAQVTRLVNEREVWIVFAVNPDGWVYDISGNTYQFWRRSRQHNVNNPNLGVDLNRNYGYKWDCCGGADDRVWAWNYHGPYPFSAPETQAIRDFVAGRVIDGKQQIRTHVTLHTDGEMILYPWSWTTSRREGMNPTDYLVFRAMAGRMASMNGYKPQQSSMLYRSDGDEIDWMYATYRIFSFTLELYPTEKVAGTKGIFYPSARVIARQTARNRSALLYLIDMSGCPYAAVGLTCAAAS